MDGDIYLAHMDVYGNIYISLCMNNLLLLFSFYFLTITFHFAISLDSDVSTYAHVIGSTLSESRIVE